MKILHTVEFYDPSSGGAQEVVRQLSTRMAAQGHDVTVATTGLPERKSKLIDKVKIEEFDVEGNAVVGIRGEAERYKKFLTEGDFDIMMNYAAQQWATDLAFETLDKIKAKKVLVPCGYSALSNPAFKDYFSKLPAILKNYDTTVYLTEHYRDIDFARAHGIKNLEVIPNGADENEFKDLIDKRPFRQENDIEGLFIVTIGNHTGSKGHLEAMRVLEKLPFAATLAIIGKPVDEGCFETCKKEAERINQTSGSGRHKKRVIIFPIERSETLKAIKSADVFLLLSNIEASPIVLFEAAASAVPFVASAAGNSAEIAHWTGGGVIVKTTPDGLHEGNVFASIDSTAHWLIVLKYLPFFRKYLGRRGRKNWQDHFTWQNITERYLSLYKDILR